MSTLWKIKEDRKVRAKEHLKSSKLCFSMGDNIPKYFWMKKVKKLRTENTTHWAELNTKVQKQTNEGYIDIMIGRKGEGREKGQHFGIKLDQTIHYIDPKRIHNLGKINRKVYSKNKGFLEVKEEIFNQITNPKDLDFSINIDGTTKEITIKSFKLKK